VSRGRAAVPGSVQGLQDVATTPGTATTRDCVNTVPLEAPNALRVALPRSYGSPERSQAGGLRDTAIRREWTERAGGAYLGS